MSLVGSETKMENAIVAAGDEALEKGMDIMETYCLPGGLMALTDVLEAGIVEETGQVWIKQKSDSKHHFKKADRHVSFSANITCKIEKMKMKNIKGVKVRDMLFWVPIHEIEVDQKNPDKLIIRSIGGFSRTFPVEYFARGE